jgi:hypothetical protein
MARGTDGFAGDLVYQRRFLRSRFPLYEALLAAVDPGAPALARGWAARDFEAPYDRPLLLLAALRFGALRAGGAHPLAAALAADQPDPAVITPANVAAALAWPGLEELLAARRVQTNEVSRAVAWRWPAALLGADRRVMIVDLGCSAGLNLAADAMPARWVDAAGAPIAVAAPGTVVARLGLDRAPLDPRDADDADWLRACIWPGERDRLAAFEAAMAAFRRAPPRIETLAAEAMPARLGRLREETDPRVMIIAYQSLLRDYLAPAERAAFTAGMQRWLAADPAALWVELETAPHGATRELPAALVATAGSETDPPVSFLLARCAYHPTALHVDDRAVGEVVRRCAPRRGTAPRSPPASPPSPRGR